MINSGNLVKNVVTFLKSKPELNNIDFVEAYENEIKPTPLNRPICAISVRDCYISEKLTNILPTGEIIETNKRNMTVNLSFDLFIPYSMGGNEGHMIFDRITNIFLKDSSYNIMSAKCYKSRYDKICSAIVVRSNIKFKTKIVP